MKNLLVYISLLAVLIAVSTGGGVELLRGAGDVITRTSPRMTCGLLNVIQVNSDSISVCILGANVMFRRQGLLNQTLQQAEGATVELSASTIGACAKLAAEAGLAAFEFSTKCLAYNSSICFKKCDTSCDRFIFVTSNSCAKEPRLVSLDEAPWKPGPYNDTREYRLEKLIYLDESNMTEPYGAGVPYDPDRYRNGYSYTTLQNGSTFAFSTAHTDLSTCLFYDGDAGLPTLVSPIYINYTFVKPLFMESCGNTIKIPPSSTVDDKAKENFFNVVYSHRGYGCSEFPGKTYVNCTVNIEFDDGYNAYFNALGLDGPNGKCDGFTFTMEKDGAKKNICDGPYHEFNSGGRYAFTLQGSASDSRLGFYFYFGLRELVA